MLKNETANERFCSENHKAEALKKIVPENTCFP